MGFLFFNSEEEISIVSKQLTHSLGLPKQNEGDSLNVQKGVYFSSKLLGIKIKLEYN